MPANWLVTSGTSPLRQLPKTTHFVSIDGATEETHDAVRRSPGLYRRILRNLERARAQGSFPTYLHTVLNARNQCDIREVLRIWSANGLADGVLFSTHTPIKDAADDDLRLSRYERIEVVKTLRRAREEFGDFCVNTPEMIDDFHPDVTEHQTPANCGVARMIPSFDASGKRMNQCILSNRADCTQCGCVVTAMVKMLMHFPPKMVSVRTLARLRTK